MQVLRRGGEHLEAREYWRWVALAIVLVTVLVALAVAFRQLGVLRPSFPAALIPVLLVLLVAGPAVRRITARIRAVRKGRLGEKLVTELLAGLPDEYYLVNDVGLGAGNIDHVVTGPCGIVVIETKRIAGHIGSEGAPVVGLVHSECDRPSRFK
jgi:hypothetical protein